MVRVFAPVHIMMYSSLLPLYTLTKVFKRVVKDQYYAIMALGWKISLFWFTFTAHLQEQNMNSQCEYTHTHINASIALSVDEYFIASLYTISSHLT